MPSWRLALVGLLALAACFSPDIDEGVPCGPLGECPSGFSCRSGSCRSGPGGADGGPDGPVGVDGRAADAGGRDGLDFVDASPPPDASRFDAGPSGTVNLSFLGTGGGTVSGGGSSCTSDCPLAFPIGTVVTLSATPAGGSTFVSWGGACSGSGSCMVTVAATPATVTATFNRTSDVQLILVEDGPGDVTRQPAGQSCGVDCWSYAPGTSVLLTATPTPGFSTIGWSGGGCEARGTSPCTVVLNSDTTVTARFCTANRVVDAATGSDVGNPGTCVAPYRTVSKALSVATTGQIVQVRPGTYNAALGELFPLVVPDGVTLRGDEPLRGTGQVPTRLDGGGAVSASAGSRATVVLGSRSILAGFLVVNAQAISNSHGVMITKASPANADAAVVRNTSVQDCIGDGIVVERATGASLSGNVIVQNNGSGVRIAASAVGTVLEDNVVADNTFGVETSAAVDLGGGDGGSLGGNILACNVETDLLVNTPNAPVTADDNGWDHVPPTSTDACLSGFDVCTSGATVRTDGAFQAPACI